MKTASYWIGDKEHKGFVVGRATGPDGPVVDLSVDGKKKPFIRGAPVADSPTPGHATLTGEAEPEPEKPEGGKKPAGTKSERPEGEQTGSTDLPPAV